jgi:hypothetical protein
VLRCAVLCCAEEEAALAPESNALAPDNLPPQLLFVHGGQTDLKEMHWHPQVCLPFPMLCRVLRRLFALGCLDDTASKTYRAGQPGCACVLLEAPSC